VAFKSGSWKMISILLATYNWPQALKLCLESLATQGDRDFEIIIADDGSTKETKELIDSMRSSLPVPITHLWQEDMGFRKTTILNQAISAAQGDYLVFLDGDCLVQPDFVAKHRELAQQGHLVTGSRVLLSEALTKELLQWPRWNFQSFMAKLLQYRLHGGINKYWPLKIKLGDGSWRHYKKFVWRRIKGCNMACWKADAKAIHGFDETMTGWGHEDADFVFRLQRNHIIRKSGSWATEVFHLFHKIHDQSNAAENARRVREKILAKAL
jgi:glycosyltransferase involved in cell wall biosynthesis